MKYTKTLLRIKTDLALRKVMVATVRACMNPPQMTFTEADAVREQELKELVDFIVQAEPVHESEVI